MTVTYGLEEHMGYLGYRSPGANVLASLWTVHKAQLIRKTVPNPELFGTYSDHGSSHSSAIVCAINRLLGSDRIRLLEETDTWLLLECAYRHDMGMHVRAREISEFINSHEYKEWLRYTSESNDKQLREAAKHLMGQRHLGKDCMDMNAAERTQLVIEYKKYLNMVLSGYYRGKHAERSANALNSEVCKFDDNDIPDRLWKVLEQICLGHTLDRQAAYNSLNYEEQGICNDTAHPRLVQTLLRLGDLLDLDNNRFNPYCIEQWGEELPDESVAHLLKHKAVKHFYIGPDRIEVEADIQIEEKHPTVEFGCLCSEKEAFYKKTINDTSEKWNKNPYGDVADENDDGKQVLSADKVIDKLMGGCFVAATADVRLTIEKQIEHYALQARLQNKACRVCADWFKWLEEELQFFAINWQQICPAYISGSVPKLTNKKIFWQGREMDYDTINLKYSISHKRAAGIIQGTGLYGNNVSKKAISNPSLPNKELVFIRELIQNAMDATKIQAFRYLKEDKYCKSLLELGNKASEWNPIKVLNCIGDSIDRLNVGVKISYEIDVLRTENNKRRPRLKIEVKDVGTGINNASLKSMSMIGSTRNEAIQNEIQQMPEWLKPNGSFGIGMQAVFGIVDEFRAVSGSRTDHIVRDMFFKSSENNGELFAAERIENDAFNYGTEIIVDMDESQLERIYASIAYHDEGFEDDCHSTPYLGFSCDFLFSELRNQIDSVLGQDVFPINVVFTVNEIEIKQYNIYRKSVFSELVDLYRHVHELPITNPPYSMLSLQPNDVDNISISEHRALLASDQSTPLTREGNEEVIQDTAYKTEQTAKQDGWQNKYIRINNKNGTGKMRSAIPLSDYAFDGLPVSERGKIIPLISEQYNPDGRIRLLHYCERHQILLKMDLHDFGHDHVLDGRVKQSGALRRVEFYYRGMNVVGVKNEYKIVYPCWDIEAHAFFDEAENIISISRNHILPSAENDVYKRIAESADEALELLFSWLSKEENFQIITGNGNASNSDSGGGSDSVNVCDGLYLSLLYYQITSMYNDSSRLIEYQGLYERLKKESRLRVPVLKHYHNGVLSGGKMLLKDVFENGVYDKWYVNPEDMPYTEIYDIAMEDDAKTDNILFLAQDIFMEYLLSRKFSPMVSDIHVLKKSDICHFAFIHKITKTNVTGYKLSDRLLRLAIKDMIETYVNNTIANKPIDRMSSRNDSVNNPNDSVHSPNDFPLLPALDSYPQLSLPNPPVAIPKKLRSIGKYLIVPFTISQLRIIKKDSDRIRTEIETPDKKRNWLKNFLNADSIDMDVPFLKLCNFVYTEITKHGATTSFEKVKQCYLEAASDLLSTYITSLTG